MLYKNVLLNGGGISSFTVIMLKLRAERYAGDSFAAWPKDDKRIPGHGDAGEMIKQIFL
jgi:hypothetical protein